VIFKRGRYGELVTRQLDLLVADEPSLLADIDDARQAYEDAPRDEAEERFGDYQFALEALKDRIRELRDIYGATLDDPEPYERELERAALRRWPDIAGV
jgi:hypothetical protein